MFLIYSLIIIFTILIIYPIILAFFGNNKNTIIEGMDSTDSDYKPYNLNDPNNALILGQQNAGNIEVLKGRMDSYSNSQNNIQQKVDSLQQNVDSLQTQIQGLVQQQADFAQEIAGTTPPVISGTDT